MASIRKVGKGWRAEVARKGVRMSQMFDTKTAAKEWAARQEYLILNDQMLQSKQTFGEVMDRYAREVSPTKKGERWEQIRIELLKRYPLAGVPLSELKPVDLAAWRDARLREVSPATVKREMVLMSAILTQARKEWGLIKESPMQDVRKPSDSAPRDRRPTPEELERLAHVAGRNLNTMIARAYHAFLFAIETGMRAGEILGLTQDRVDRELRVCRLPMTKNGSARDVALSQEALRLLDELPVMDPVWGLNSSQLDAQWRKICGKAKVENLHFHDSRHEAITRLARKLDVLSLARMIGHRNLNELMTYYNESAADLAKRLG